MFLSPVKEGLYGLAEEKVVVSAFDLQQLKEEASACAKLKQELGSLRIDTEYQEQVKKIEAARELNEMKCENDVLRLKNAMLIDENTALRESLEAATATAARAIAKQSVSATRGKSPSKQTSGNAQGQVWGLPQTAAEELFEYRLESLRAQKQIMEQQRNQAVAELAQLINVAAAREQEMGALRRKITKMENIIRELEEAQSKAARMQSKEARQLETALREAELRVASLEQGLAKMGKENQMRRGSPANEQQEKQRALEEAKRKVGETVTHKVLEWQVEKASLEEKWAGERSSLEGKCKQAEARAQQLEIALSKAESKIESLEREADELRERLDAAVTSRNNMKAKFKEAKEKVDAEIEQMVKETEDRIAKMRQDHEVEMARLRKHYEDALKMKTTESAERAISEARITAERTAKELERTTQEALRAAKEAAEAAATKALKEAQEREEKMRLQIERERAKIEKEKEKAEKARERAEEKAEREREKALKQKAEKEALAAKAREAEKILEKVVSKTVRASRNASSAVASADSTLDEIDKALAASRKASAPSLAAYINSLGLNTSTTAGADSSAASSEGTDDNQENTLSAEATDSQVTIGAKRAAPNPLVTTPLATSKIMKFTDGEPKPVPSMAGRPPLSATPLAKIASVGKMQPTAPAINPIAAAGIGNLGPARKKAIVPKLKRNTNL